MEIARFKEIREKFNLQDELLYLYVIKPNGTLRLKSVSEYELLAEEGLKGIYDFEPDGLWEQCLEG